MFIEKQSFFLYNYIKMQKGGNGMFGFFKKQKNENKRAMIFVDYEHWFISFDRFYHKKPDIKAFRDQLSQSYDIVDIIFFADFSNAALRAEISRIREVTGSIIETQNSSAYFKKDFTDFIMLDRIYQEAMLRADIDTFIIFSGDGHFSSVVSFLKTKCRKEVGIYGVKDALSSALKGAADWTVEVTGEDDCIRKFAPMILKSIRNIQDRHGKQRARVTFWGTVEAVSKNNGVEKSDIAETLRKLLEKEYMRQVFIRAGTKKIKVISVNWDKCRKDGLIE